ncbi:MAG: hypothetical protein HOD78_01315 [Flavobacteriaceae bacterium]|nr:hypothetical protein [Flavobacteriaceae bacterium]MBT7575048.1 hypothetical protein [Flavobacteriaceae bacterium]
MKILKWFLFIVFSILSVVSLIVVYLMYNNLSFIDYPYVISATTSALAALIAYRYKLK